jgi:hypothetical protein
VPSPPPQQQADAQPASPTPAQIALHAAELYALEQAAARAITAPLRSRLIRIQRDAAAAWIRAFGSLNATADPIRLGQILADIARALTDITPDASTALGTWAGRALDLGIRQAGRETGTGTTRISAGLDDQTLRTIAAADARIGARIADAEAALNTAGPAFGDVAAALAHAHRAATDTQAAVIQAVNGAANTGIAAVADDLGAQRLWIAEPDACLTCIGMSGRLADPGEAFDTAFAATYTPKPRIWPPGPIGNPPIHPHCRCRITAWTGSAGPGVDLPAALRREAQRSVLKGWSLPSESGPARVRAAQQLLNRGVAAPQSVKAYARAAVRRGRFTTRTVPAPPSRKDRSTP